MNSQPDDETLNNNLTTYYTRQAKEYERVYDKPERQADIAYLVDYLRTSFYDLHALEITCGTGYWTQHLAENARSIVATDISPAVLAVAKTKGFSRQNVTFRLADLYDLLAPDQQFDVGFGGFIWSHIAQSRLPDFLLSFHQQIKKGGKVTFIDNRFVAGSSTPLATKDEEGNTFQRRQLENSEEYLALKNFPSEMEVRRAIGNTARDIRLQFLTYYWILTYRI